NREIMGATDPKKAAQGTIRADLALSIEQNVVHGSDAPDTAAREIAYFFSAAEAAEAVMTSSDTTATNLLGLPRPALEAFVAELGSKPFRARQLMNWV